MKYKTQHTILSLYILTFIYNLSAYVFSWPVDRLEFIAESGMFIACFAVMYYITPLRAFPKVYWLMLLGSAFFSMSAFMDLSEEFFIGSGIRESNLDDILKTLGFILLSIGIYRWMNLHQEFISELRAKAETDQLTGLLNRRAFIEKIMGEYKPNDGEGRALLMLDVDHFKSINDSYGHACGDLVLATAANELKSLIRENDLLARWGGEEFLFHLLDVNEEKSIEIADALRQSIEQLSFECNSKIINCTVSIGVYHAFSSKCLETEVDCADQALYQAKNAGRNCVVLFKE